MVTTPATTRWRSTNATSRGNASPLREPQGSGAATTRRQSRSGQSDPAVVPSPSPASQQRTRANRRPPSHGCPSPPSSYRSSPSGRRRRRRLVVVPPTSGLSATLRRVPGRQWGDTRGRRRPHQISPFPHGRQPPPRPYAAKRRLSTPSGRATALMGFQRWESKASCVQLTGAVRATPGHKRATRKGIEGSRTVTYGNETAHPEVAPELRFYGFCLVGAAGLEPTTSAV